LIRQGVKSDERITHEEIAERDNFICHICEQAVDMSLPRTSKFGATLDHVIPVSKGGVDSRENLKLAHWICNIKKSDKILGVEGVASKAE
jgi:5-methylcytosine-specific restriction endonuclease McrA